nr:histamine H3 receptor-like [Lytechinus pictus]
MEISNPLANGTFFDKESANGHRYSLFQLAILSFIFSVIIAVTVIGNTFVILAYIQDSHIRSTVANMYILNLAVTDFIVGAFSLTFNLSRFISGFWPHGEIICKLWSILDYTVVNVSWLTMILISRDRFLLVTMGLKYQTYQTKRRVGLTLASIWTIVLTYWSLIAFAWSPISGLSKVDYDTTCLMEYLFNPVAPIIINFVYFSVSFVILLLMNIAVYVKVRQRSKGIVGHIPLTDQSGGPSSQIHRVPGSFLAENNNSGGATTSRHIKGQRTQGTSADRTIVTTAASTASHQGSVPVQDNTHDVHRKTLRKHHKAAVVLGILSGCFLLCWLPYIASSVVFSFCGGSCIPALAWEVTEAISWCNSMINPFIYAATNVNFRKNFKRLLMINKCSPNGAN